MSSRLEFPAAYSYLPICMSILATSSSGIAQVAPEPAHVCIGAQERATVAQALAAYTAAHGPLSSASQLDVVGTPPLFAFYPHSGNVTGDLQPSALVDLDPSAGILSFDCGHWSYDGHTGLDSEIRGFNSMAIGVPVLAALDGTVVFVHDGEFDMETVPAGQPGNGVIIDHGFGRICSYWHFKTNSIAVSLGQFVRAGTQLGLTGSSGSSTGPHLHFESWDNNTTNVEPFAGACRPGASAWVDQPPINAAPHIWDLSITATDPTTLPGYPYPKPRDAQIAFSDQKVYVYMIGLHPQASGSYRYRFFRPDSTLAHDTGALVYPNAQSYWLVGGIYAEQWHHSQGFDIADMHSIAGTWRVTMEFDGATVVDAPFEVVAVRDPNFNRPPRAVTAAFDPPAPTEQDVLFCRLGDTGPIYLSDPDWDVVRFHYVWTVNGNVVRDVTSAGMADALPRLSVPNGSSVTCTVTPSDGKANGTLSPLVIAVEVSGDCNGNGIRDVDDIAAGTSADCSGNGIPDECEPDCNGNGIADSCDIASGAAQDCSGNGIPDSCEADCDASGVADSCEIAAGTSLDCDADGVPNQCEIDCNQNGLPDDCEAVPALAGSCLEFDGVDDTIELPATGLNFGGTITIEAWIRPEATDGIRIILGHGSPFSRKGGALFILDAQYGVVGVNHGVHFAQAPMHPADIGHWVHLAGVHDGAAWLLYRNGELISARPDTFGVGVGGAPWAIGSGGGGFSNFFQGGIDEVRLWQVARTQAQIQASMNTTLTGNEPGLRGYWRLDELSGDKAFDSAPQGGASDGVLQGGATRQVNQPCLGG